jgi:hypothetical protein
MRAWRVRNDREASRCPAETGRRAEEMFRRVGESNLDKQISPFSLALTLTLATLLPSQEDGGELEGFGEQRTAGLIRTEKMIQDRILRLRVGLMIPGRE